LPSSVEDVEALGHPFNIESMLGQWNSSCRRVAFDVMLSMWAGLSLRKGVPATLHPRPRAVMVLSPLLEARWVAGSVVIFLSPRPLGRSTPNLLIMSFIPFSWAMTVESEVLGRAHLTRCHHRVVVSSNPSMSLGWTSHRWRPTVCSPLPTLTLGALILVSSPWTGSSCFIVPPHRRARCAQGRSAHLFKPPGVPLPGLPSSRIARAMFLLSKPSQRVRLWGSRQRLPPSNGCPLIKLLSPSNWTCLSLRKGVPATLHPRPRAVMVLSPVVRWVTGSVVIFLSPRPPGWSTPNLLIMSFRPFSWAMTVETEVVGSYPCH